MAVVGNLRNQGQGISRISLKQRFSAVIIGLLIVTITFCALLLYGQHRTAMRGADVAIRSQEEIVLAMQTREALIALERAARAGAPHQQELKRFRALFEASVVNQSEEMARRSRARFSAYVQSLDSETLGSRLDSERDRYGDVLTAINSVIDINQEKTHELAEKLRESQIRSIRAALAFLSIFILVLAVASHQIIAIISEPFSLLVRFLDTVDVEQDLPARFLTSIRRSPRFSAWSRALSSCLRGCEGTGRSTSDDS